MNYNPNTSCSSIRFSGFARVCKGTKLVPIRVLIDDAVVFVLFCFFSLG